MFHLNTELLIDYWRRRRGERAAPSRGDIDPAAFASLLSQVFVAVRQDDGDYRFRIVGEAINDWHGRSLQGENLVLLWRPDHRRHLASALAAALRAPSPLVISAESETGDDDSCRFEILFAPLRGPSDRADRFIGLYQPLSAIEAESRGAARVLTIRSVNGAESRRPGPSLRLAAVDGRRIA